MSEKIVSVNLKALKTKTLATGKKAGSAAFKTLDDATKALRGKAKDQTGKIVGTVLDRTITLTESQLKGLQRLKEKAVR